MIKTFTETNDIDKLFAYIDDIVSKSVASKGRDLTDLINIAALYSNQNIIDHLKKKSLILEDIKKTCKDIGLKPCYQCDADANYYHSSYNCKFKNQNSFIQLWFDISDQDLINRFNTILNYQYNNEEDILYYFFAALKYNNKEYLLNKFDKMVLLK